MKLARSLIGVFVANQPFATEYFHNLFLPLLRAPGTSRSDQPALAQPIAAGGLLPSRHFSLRRLLGLPPNAVLLSRSPRVR